MTRKSKPILDEQRLEEISHVISSAMANRDPISITLYDPYEELIVVGKISRIDGFTQKIKLDTGNEVLWILLSDILAVSTS